MFMVMFPFLKSGRKVHQVRAAKTKMNAPTPIGTLAAPTQLAATAMVVIHVPAKMAIGAMVLLVRNGKRAGRGVIIPFGEAPPKTGFVQIAPMVSIRPATIGTVVIIGKIVIQENT